MNFKSEIQKKSKIRIGITYIVEQKQFGGKDLDFLIIHMKSEEDIYVYGFQVSIYKSNIFTIKELQSSYNLLIDVLKKSFELNVKKNLMFFGYIFDYSRINDYKAKLKICDKNNLKYVLFNTKNNNFYLNEKETTRDINAITIKVFNEENDIYNNDIKIKKLYDDEYNLNAIYNKKLIYIKDCLNNHLNLKINSLNFIENTDKITFYEHFLYVQFLNDSIYLILFLDNKIKQYEIKNNEIKEEILILKNKKMNKYEIIFEK
jgi:formylmethanofuran dehydrogenase subunit E-like metal-binding protein